LSRADWVRDGGLLNVDAARSAEYPSLACNGTTPYVAWDEYNGTYYQLYVKHYNGAAWVQDGAALNINPASHALESALVFVGSTPYVSWMEHNGTAWQIYVKHYNGAAWVQDGASLNFNPSHWARFPEVATDGVALYVAWEENNGTVWQIFVKHFNGTAWVQDGAALNVDEAHNAECPRMAFDGATPYVAWEENNGTAWQIYVKHYNGAAWVQDGASLNVNTSRSSDSPSLACNGTVPYVAWVENDGTNRQIYVKHYSGAAWVQDGASLNVNTACNVYSPSLAFSGTTPYVAWDEDNGTYHRIYIKHYEGAAWVQDGGSLNINTDCNAASPSLAFSGTTPYVAWHEVDTSGFFRQVSVKHYVPPTPTVTPSCTLTVPLTSTPTMTPTVAVTPPPGTVQGAGSVIPNPFAPGLGRRAHFNFPLTSPGAAFTIRILNLRGRWVRTLNGEADWDGRDDAGNRCEGGVYVYQIEAEGRRYGGTLAMIQE